MSVPKITVLTTVFNAEPFLDAAIASVLSQTFRDFEFLIVDDASSDGSGEIARRWERKDARVRILTNARNAGQTACLNQGLREARGRFIARQDADDLSHPERLARQHEAFLAQPELVLLGTCGRIIDDKDRLMGLLDAPIGHHAIEWTSPLLNPFLHTSVMFHTGTIQNEFGGYDEAFRIAQDYELWTRVIARHPSANLQARLVCYRHLERSLSKSGRAAAFAEARRVSCREAQRVYGRPLTEVESDLFASFREGLSPKDRRDFWALYHELLAHAVTDRNLRCVEAVHHLKAAGALSLHSRLHALSEVCQAILTAPRVTIAWLLERYVTA